MDAANCWLAVGVPQRHDFCNELQRLQLEDALAPHGIQLLVQGITDRAKYACCQDEKDLKCSHAPGCRRTEQLLMAKVLPPSGQCLRLRLRLRLRLLHARCHGYGSRAWLNDVRGRGRRFATRGMTMRSSRIYWG